MCGAQRVIMLNQHYLGTHACVMRLEIASKSMEKCGVGVKWQGLSFGQRQFRSHRPESLHLN